MTYILFDLCNSIMLLAWTFLLFLPKWSFTERLIAYPWVPLGISFFYVYFLIVSGGLAEADFSTLDGITSLFRLSTPESAAAGWLHYLAFDFWAGTWIIRHSRRHQISHWAILFPLLCTFMLGPIGIMVYSVVYFIKRQLKKAK
mgnify:CR=1 FL=1|jgi:hypothetical protein